MLIRSSKIVTLNIIYYRPDYQSLIQEFIYSFADYPPELMMTYRFLDHWRNNIDAVIKEVLIAIDGNTPTHLRTVDQLVEFKH